MTVAAPPRRSLAELITAVPAIDPSAEAIEFEGRWWTWGELDTTIADVAEVVPAPGTQVGIILRNTPPHVGALLGVLRTRGCVVTINPQRGLTRTREDIAALDLDVIIGTDADLDELVEPGTVRTTVALRNLGTAPVVTLDDSVAGDSPRLPGVAVLMLTSGTTGTPKRVELSEDLLERVVADAKYYERDKAADLRLRSGIVVVNSPLVHLGGLFRILQCLNDGRSFCLLERFTVDGWSDAVRRHRPKTASLVPAALRMVLEAGLDPEWLSSLRTVVSGTAPLDPDDADAFFDRYGVRVLISFAATEFGGAVAGWNLADHEQWWATKRGSVGRAHPGCDLRVVRESDGEVLTAGDEGLLEVRAGQLGSTDWIRTTDLATIDEDGFVFIRGRADQAIIRGGFKVLPETVRKALERHPAVRGAAVIGRDDARLGAVPVAVVELRGEASEQDLLDHATEVLAPYEVPVEIHIVDALPRTDSHKVDLTAVRHLLAAPTFDASVAHSAVEVSNVEEEGGE